MIIAPPGSKADALAALRGAEAQLLAWRAVPADPEAAVVQALAVALGDAVPAALLAAGQRIAAAVRAHGCGFASGREPPYHNCHHQAEATRVAGWLAGALHGWGVLTAGQAASCVLAMAGHDLLHDGTRGAHPGALEARSAAATDLLITDLDDAARAEVSRLILLTDLSAPAPLDAAGRLMREADLFGSLTPDLGWQLSVALSGEIAAAGLGGAEQVVRFSGRLWLLQRIGTFTTAATALGLAAGCALQVRAMAVAAEAPTPEAGAAILDGCDRDAAMEAYRAAMDRLGLPSLPR